MTTGRTTRIKPADWGPPPPALETAPRAHALPDSWTVDRQWIGTAERVLGFVPTHEEWRRSAWPYPGHWENKGWSYPQAVAVCASARGAADYAAYIARWTRPARRLRWRLPAPFYTRTSLILILQAYAVTYGVVPRLHYWVDQPGLKQTVWIRRFGSYARALEAAGLLGVPGFPDVPQERWWVAPFERRPEKRPYAALRPNRPSAARAEQLGTDPGDAAGPRGVRPRRRLTVPGTSGASLHARSAGARLDPPGAAHPRGAAAGERGGDMGELVGE